MTATTAPTVDEVIDSRPLSALQIGVVALCAAVVFVDGYDIQSMGIVTRTIAADWGIVGQEDYGRIFGWVNSASLVGMALSAFAAPLGDRFGRVPAIVAGLLVVASGTIATALSTGVEPLILARALTGLGLGVCQANAVALASEYAPARRRSGIIMLAGVCVGIGALLAGLIAPVVIGGLGWGWPGVFWVGGIAPLVLAAAFLALAPESVRLLATRRPDDPRIARIMARLAPGQDFRAARGPAPAGSTLLGALPELLGARRAGATVGLWVVYACASFLLYLIMSWLTTILAEASWSPAQAQRGIVALQLGGILGMLAIWPLVDGGRPYVALVGAFAAGAIGAVLFAILPPTLLGWSLIIALTGVGVFAPTYALFGVAAQVYPPGLRAAGFGWMAAVSRVSAVFGPIVGGELLRVGIPARYVAAFLAVPAVICIVTTLILRMVVAPDGGGRVRAPEPRVSA